MVGLDLDGTVFNNNKEITAHTRNVLEEAIRQGCVVLPATGRPEIGLPKAFLEIPGVEYALTSNGARIIRIPSGETVYEELIPWDVTLQVIEVMKQWAGESCNWETYFDGKIYVEEETYHFVRHESMSPAMEQYIRSTRTRQKHLTEKIRVLLLYFSQTDIPAQRSDSGNPDNICSEIPSPRRSLGDPDGAGKTHCRVLPAPDVEARFHLPCSEIPERYYGRQTAAFCSCGYNNMFR